VRKPLSIQRPTLVLDEEKCLRNIQRMANKAQASGVRFRPHFKTHQSAQIGEWFRAVGVQSITVSSVEMAAYFARHGWNDITVAFPVNLLEVARIDELAGRIRLNLLVGSMETAQFLAKNLTHGADVWIDVDVGDKRTGIWWERSHVVVAIAQAIQDASNLGFRGILTHAGHTYDARSRQEIREIYSATESRMVEVQQALRARGFSEAEISVGDTPGCSIVERLGAADEVRPGTFVFYDAMQVSLGACSWEDLAVAVACPVVERHQERGELVLYGGAVHLSKEFIVEEDGTKVFGYVAAARGDGWRRPIKNAYVSSLTQEHGVVRVGEEVLSEVCAGDVLMVLPVHSCLLPNLLKTYVTLDGETIDSLATSPEAR
jgi:D-serine deaminase-like pyridoxal phosphate-dependent protein